MEFPLTENCNECPYSGWCEERTFCMCDELEERRRHESIKTRIGTCPSCRSERQVLDPVRNETDRLIMAPYDRLCIDCLEPREAAYYARHGRPQRPMVDDDEKLVGDVERCIAQLFDSMDYPADDTEWC